MLKLLILIFLAHAATHADSGCEFLLGTGGYKAVVAQIQKLNPEILSGLPAPTSVEMFVRLKRESEKYAASEIPFTLARALRVTQRRHFTVGTMDLPQLSIFYRNALRALVQRAAALWRRQEVRALAGGPLAPRVQKFAEHLLDTFFSPNGLNDEALSAGEAMEYFRARPWAGFNWESAIATVASQPAKSARAIEIPRVFDWNEGHRIRLALQQDRRPGACCLTEPGCTLCPHNRAVLRR